MNQNAAIGSKIKQLRIAKNYTLKQLSEESGLSVGFLSQFERGLSSIAIDSLEKLAEILDASLLSFFDGARDEPQSPVTHSFDLLPDAISPQIYQYMLCRDMAEFALLPRMFLLMPFAGEDDAPEMYSHDGEEFIYVLEGIVTVYLEQSQYVLYPGDSVQIHSRQRHNWANRTNKAARILTINSPNPFRENAAHGEEPSIHSPS